MGAILNKDEDQADSVAPAAAIEERIDPGDGTAYTWKQFVAYYRDISTAEEILEYWERCPLLTASSKAPESAAKAAVSLGAGKVSEVTPHSVPLSWEVHRRYNDFKALRDNLGVRRSVVGRSFPAKSIFK